MSDFANNTLGDEVSTLDVSPQFDGYSKVTIVVDKDISYWAGDDTGRELVIENPWGTQEQANNILSDIRGYQYQPYKASDALLSPAAEIGDAVTITGAYGGIYRVTRAYSSLMSADIDAPHDEEIDHEYPFETKSDRIYQRKITEATAKIGITAQAIEAEVIRATQAEGTLSSRITQTAEAISAKVSSTGGNNSSFGWTLTASGMSLYSGGTEVFKATSAGIEVKGKITATSGAIGGFTIGTNAITYGSNMSWGSTSVAGIYFGTSGIQLGRKPKNKSDNNVNYFTASSSRVEAGNLYLRGTLSMWDPSKGSNGGWQTISAKDLQKGAQDAVDHGSTWTSGAAGGTAYKNATEQNATGPTYYNCKTLTASTKLVVKDKFTFQGFSVGTYSVKGADGKFTTVLGIAQK